MFLGHYGMALAAERAAPETSLDATVFAARWLDLLWPALLPASHGTASGGEGSAP